MTGRRPGSGTVAFAATFAIGAAVLYTFDPATTLIYPPCPLRALTGLLCPLCGSVRAAHRLLHGDVAGAFALNPLTVAGGAAVAAAASAGCLARLAAPRLLRLAAAGAIAFAIARNL